VRYDGCAAVSPCYPEPLNGAYLDGRWLLELGLLLTQFWCVLKRHSRNDSSESVIRRNVMNKQIITLKSFILSMGGLSSVSLPFCSDDDGTQ
jgi:hypothetical protein